MGKQPGPKDSIFRRLLNMSQARIGMVLMAIGFPVCYYFSNITLENPVLDQIIPIAGCAVCLIGASIVSRCIAALQMGQES